MRALDDGSLWDLEPAAGTAASAQTALLLLPGAGGNAMDFALWPHHLARRFRVLAGHYRGTAADASVTGTAEALAERVMRHIPQPLVVLGHSFGALIGYELAWRLQELRQPAVALYASAAFSPPQYSEIDLGVGTMTAETFAGLVRDIGIPLPEEDRMRHEALRSARYALSLIDACRYGPRPRPLDYPVTVLTARDDRVIPPSSAGRWAAMGRHPLISHNFPGGHDYLLHSIAPVARVLLTAHP
ncbi:alpha/beta fold hydrolase [Streptomyces olivoreticuli]